MNILNKVLAVMLLVSFSLSASGTAFAATTVDLNSAANFAVLAGSGISDTNPSTVTGDVGLSPTTGAAIGITSAEVTGTIYAVDAFGPAGSIEDPGLLTTAKNDLTAAYLAAEGQVATVLATELGGTIVTPGAYENVSGEFGITGTVTLDGEGNEDAVFIFQATSTLITASNSNVVLINGAQACNVFWQVGSSATLGTSSDFKGNILALASITDNGGSTVEGRLLARNAAVTLNNTTLTKADCNVPTPAASTSSSRAGDFKRCDTPFTPTCVEYFSLGVLVVSSTTPIGVPSTTTPIRVTVFTPGMPSTGGSANSFLPILLFSLSIGFIIYGVVHINRKKS